MVPISPGAVSASRNSRFTTSATSRPLIVSRSSPCGENATNSAPAGECQVPDVERGELAAAERAGRSPAATRRSVETDRIPAGEALSRSSALRSRLVESAVLRAAGSKLSVGSEVLDKLAARSLLVI